MSEIRKIQDKTKILNIAVKLSISNQYYMNNKIYLWSPNLS